jgi:hypothetical protein
MPADTDWELMRQRAVRSAFEQFRAVPGLRAKAFVFSPERSEFGGNYVWDTQDDAESYLRSAAWRTTVAALGEPKIERTEVCAYVECGDLVFPSSYEVKPPRASDAPASASR